MWPLVLLLASLAGSSSPPRTHTVEIRGMEFHPAALTVAPGDTVVWINRDIVPHTATAKATWDTGTLTQGATGRYIAAHPGTVRYICAFHPTMLGTLIIRKERS